MPPVFHALFVMVWNFIIIALTHVGMHAQDSIRASHHTKKPTPKKEKWSATFLVALGACCNADDSTGVSGDNRPVAPHSTDSDHRSASRHHPALRCISISPLC